MGNRPSHRQRQAAQVLETAPVNSAREEDPEYDQQTLLEAANPHTTLTFFIEHLKSETSDALQKAVSKTTRKSKVLREGWFNNQTAVFITREKRRMLTEQALTQKEVVFTSAGLTVLAAPWGYAFCSKLHRLAGGRDEAKDTDVEDAVEYLRKYLETTKAVGVRIEDIKQLCEDYSVSIEWRDESVDALVEINELYKQKFSVTEDAIVVT